VNNDSGPSRFAFHIPPESDFSISRNPYSPFPGTLIHMPRIPQFSTSITLDSLLDALRFQVIERIELWKSIARRFAAEQQMLIARVNIQKANEVHQLALESVTQSWKAKELEPATASPANASSVTRDGKGDGIEHGEPLTDGNATIPVLFPDGGLTTEGAMTNNAQNLPHVVRAVAGHYVLDLHAELQELDSDYQARIADAKWPENLEILKQYYLERFDHPGEVLLSTCVSSDATSINPAYAQHLETAERKTLEFLSTALQNCPLVSCP